jgi:hypothetical protein
MKHCIEISDTTQFHTAKIQEAVIPLLTTQEVQENKSKSHQIIGISNTSIIRTNNRNL